MTGKSEKPSPVSGGLKAQKGFYHQNSYTLLKLLERLESQELESAAAEQTFQIENGILEVDLVITRKNGVKEYHEVKSGASFPTSLTKIYKSLNVLFRIFVSENAGGKFFLVINPEPSEPLYKIASQLLKFQKKDQATSDVHSFCSNLGTEDHPGFLAFCKSLEIDSVGFSTMRLLALEKIYRLRQSLIMNSDHGLKNEGLYDILFNRVLSAIAENRGAIEINDFCGDIVDWVARNQIAANNPPPNAKVLLETETNKARSQLSQKFGLSLTDPKLIARAGDIP